MRGRASAARVTLAVFALALQVGNGDALVAQETRISAEVDTTLVTVGDRIHLTVSVEHPVGARVVWPDSLDLGPFDVLGAEALPTATEGDRVRTGAVLTLAAFELGELEIPSFSVRVEGPGEASQTLATDRFGVEVVSVGTDEGGDIRDIHGPLAIPVGVVTVGLWALVLLALLGVAFWLGRRMRRGRGGPPTARAEPPRPPHEIALEALARIEASPMLERGQVKEYHIAVSETLRIYVEARFGVPALEMTTREVVQGLEVVSAPQGFIDALRRFLDRCDLVKFAKVRPDQGASRETLALGRDLVESTVPVPEDAPSSSAVPRHDDETLGPPAVRTAPPDAASETVPPGGGEA
jgi:hypothetical protein